MKSTLKIYLIYQKIYMNGLFHLLASASTPRPSDSRLLFYLEKLTAATHYNLHKG